MLVATSINIQTISGGSVIDITAVNNLEYILNNSATHMNYRPQGLKYSDTVVNLIIISVMVPIFVCIALIYYSLMLPKESRMMFSNHSSDSITSTNKVIPVRLIPVVLDQEPVTALFGGYVREYSDISS